MNYIETALTPQVLDTLLQMSADWAAENSCRGYFPNGESDIQGNRIFLALDGDTPVGYLLGHITRAERTSTVMAEGTPFSRWKSSTSSPPSAARGWGKPCSALPRTRSGRRRSTSSCPPPPKTGRPFSIFISKSWIWNSGTPDCLRESGNNPWEKGRSPKACRLERTE